MAQTGPVQIPLNWTYEGRALNFSRADARFLRETIAFFEALMKAGTVVTILETHQLYHYMLLIPQNSVTLRLPLHQLKVIAGFYHIQDALDHLTRKRRTVREYRRGKFGPRRHKTGRVEFIRWDLDTQRGAWFSIQVSSKPVPAEGFFVRVQVSIWHFGAMHEALVIIDQWGRVDVVGNLPEVLGGNPATRDEVLTLIENLGTTRVQLGEAWPASETWPALDNP